MYALSKKTGISQSSLSNLMKRGSTPTFYTLDRICEGLGITLSQFFAGDIENLDLWRYFSTFPILQAFQPIR